MKQHRIFLLILIGSFFLRVGAIYPVHAEKYSSDEIEYIGIARHLAQSGDFVDSNGDKAIRAPFYPFMLSLFFRLFGENLLLPQIFGCLLSTFAVLLVYILSIQLWNDKKAALFSSGAAALYPGIVICSGMTQTEILYVVFFLLAIIFSIRTTTNPTLINLIGLGLFSAFAALTRAVFFGFFPILLLIAWFISRKNSISIYKRLAFSFIVYCFVLSPWTIRNYNLFNTIVPISSGGGNSLLTGNNPYATGTWRTEDGFEKWHKEKAVEKGIADIAELNEVERSALSGNIAIDFITTHPWHTIQLALKKAHIFWIYPATHTDRNISVQLLAVIFDFLLLIGVVVGIVFAPNLRRKNLFIASAILFFSLIQIALHAEARFRIPLIPLLCLYFGWGVNMLLDKQQLMSIFSSTGNIIKTSILIGIVIVIYTYTGILFL